jgi:regulator of protease activity HflC (stomatin/prohibitin superfamily)
MDDSGDVGAGGGPGQAPSSPAPIGGVVRDPREGRPPPSFTRFLRERTVAAVSATFVALGLSRPRNPDGTFGRRKWKNLGAFIGTIVFVILVWTSIHIVPPGNVAVPVTLGHSGKPLSSGFHITLPFTTTYSMSTRTQNYTMSSIKGEGALGNIDDSVSVLGADGGAAQVNATVLYRLDPKHATDVYRQVGTNYTKTIVRPSARNCIRVEFTRYSLVEAATTAWGKVEDDVSDCMKSKLQPRGLNLQDFQMREVMLSPDVQKAVNAKVAAQQTEEQQTFDRATAEQQADIARIQALGAADSETILECGGKVSSVQRDGQLISTVVPNTPTKCTKSALSPAYLQFTYIQALKALATSSNASTVVLPFSQGLTPVFNLGNATTPSTSSTPTSSP